MTREEHEVLDYFCRRDDETFTGKEVFCFLDAIFSGYHEDSEALEEAIRREDYFLHSGRKGE